MKKEVLNNVWIGEKDLTKDKEFAKRSQNEFVNLPIAEQLGNEEVAHR